MLPFSNIGDITHNVQLAVAPVFLLTAIGTLLSVLTNRLGRAVDRSRVLGKLIAQAAVPEAGDAADLRAAGEAVAARLELTQLARRTRLIYAAIVQAVLAALFICIMIAITFIDAFVTVSLAKALAALFILAMFAMIGCLTVFLREIFLAVTTARNAMR